MAAGTAQTATPQMDKQMKEFLDKKKNWIFVNPYENNYDAKTEEFMEGEELSVMAITDGTGVLPLVPAQDHKRLLDGDKGPNTGGMGAYAPVGLDAPNRLLKRVLEEIMLPTLKALRDQERVFRGVLYATLRLRLRTAPATLVSAAIFALAHGYGVVGFVSVFASGVLWALAYERTRSLLPGMLAHAASNVQATAIVLATLRF